jgi:hypothetical protein
MLGVLLGYSRIVDRADKDGFVGGVCDPFAFGVAGE